MTKKRRASAPDPLVPAHVDLRPFHCILLDVDKLLTSKFNAIASADEFRAGLNLWLRAFREVPAASLPNDERHLAALAGLSGNMEKWEAVREVAMHKFVLCSDGRWYHPVVAEKAIEAWAKLERNRTRTEAARSVRWGAKNVSGVSHASVTDSATDSKVNRKRKETRPTGGSFRARAQSADSDPKEGANGDANGSGEGARAFTQWDYLSDDGLVFISAEEIAALEADHPNVTNVRGRIRNFARTFATSEKFPDAGRRRAAIMMHITNTEDKNALRARDRAKERGQDDEARIMERATREYEAERNKVRP